MGHGCPMILSIMGHGCPASFSNKTPPSQAQMTWPFPAVIKHADMVDRVSHGLDLLSSTLSSENSRRVVQHWLKAMVRRDTVSAIKVIWWANSGVADADIALREVASEMLDCGEPMPTTIASYVAQALHRPQVARSRGGDTADNWLRDLAIAVSVAMAVEYWHPWLPVSRNRASKSPSASFIVSEALNRRKIMVGERRVEKIYQRFASLLTRHQAVMAILLSASNRRL